MATVFKPIGTHQTQFLNETLTLTPANGAGILLIQISGFNIRYTLDGTNPVNNTGFILNSKEEPIAIPVSSSTIIKIAPLDKIGLRIQYQWGVNEDI